MRLRDISLEMKDKIIFLHKLEPGPANQSYGLQVAQLAGVPKSIVRVAKKQLGELENQQAAHHPQGDLFAQTSKSNAPNTAPIGEFEAFKLIDALDDIRPDELSPKEALDTLYRLKNLRGAPS